MTDWRPGTWLKRIRPSRAKREIRDRWQAVRRRCSRCGVWPDQVTGVQGDWFYLGAAPVPEVVLCPGCHERVMHEIGRRGFAICGLDDAVRQIASRWPLRGMGKLMNIDLITIIDVEASGLGVGCYPLEVGWVHSDGNGDNVLIAEETWLRERPWDAEAQAIHGLSREFLRQHGC